VRDQLANAERWVIKVGSSLLTAHGKGLDHNLIQSWSEQISALMADGKQVVLVSSGSIAEGLARLGWDTRPNKVHDLQAAAAVGQMGLIRAYEAAFETFNQNTAQVLLTHEDMADRRRYLNARATLSTLLDLNVLPIINENDTVITDEIRLGDNDTLAAMVVGLIGADVLVLLTDQEGLFDKDPSKHSDAKLLAEANASDESVQALAGPSGTEFGSGGMYTKITAAVRAARSGASTIIASGQLDNALQRIAAGEDVGTLLTAEQRPQDARKQWLSNQLHAKGSITLDAGAVRNLCDKGSSLLAVGVTKCEGDFKRGELVACVDSDGIEIARGLINYSSDETRLVLGKPSKEFASVLIYEREPELIHRDNLILSSN